MTTSIPIYVISLARAKERRRHMQTMLETIGLNATFVDAIDAGALTASQRIAYSDAQSRRVYGCSMTDAELACYLSHLKAYDALLASSAEAALVLEDDVTCLPDLTSILAAIKPADAPWLVLRLQSTKTSVAQPKDAAAYGKVVDRIAGHDVCQIRTGVLGGCGYVIRREGAQRLISRSRNVYMPIDQTIDRYWENGIAPYVLRPLPVRHDYLFASEIGARGRASAKPLTLFGQVVRRTQRLVDSANKRLFWLRYGLSGRARPFVPLSLGRAAMLLSVLPIAAAVAFAKTVTDPGPRTAQSLAAATAAPNVLASSPIVAPPTPRTPDAVIAKERASPRLQHIAAPPTLEECQAMRVRRAERALKRALRAADAANGEPQPQASGKPAPEDVKERWALCRAMLRRQAKPPAPSTPFDASRIETP